VSLPQNKIIKPLNILGLDNFVTDKSLNHHRFYTSSQLLKELNPTLEEQHLYDAYLLKLNQSREMTVKSSDLGKK
jgi:hypothetical protein